MASADTLLDYIKSPTNVSLLTRFSTDRVLPEWASLGRKRVQEAVELVLEDCIETSSAPFRTWALTPENIADVNIAIWKSVKVAVEKALKGATVDPEVALEEMLGARGRMLPFDEPKSEGVVEARELETLRDQYMNSWRT